MIIAALLAAFQALDVTSKAPVSLPPLPRGTSLTLHEEFSNNEYDFGGSVWPAAGYRMTPHPRETHIS